MTLAAQKAGNDGESSGDEGGQPTEELH